MSWTARQREMLQAMGLGQALPPLAQDSPVPPAHAAQAKEHTQAMGSAETRAPARPIEAAAPVSPKPPATAPREAAPGAAPGALDWPALRQAVADCRACGLCEGRTQTVFGAGHAQAHWMVVGEAPGEQEDLAGEPFVGPAGQLLDRMLQALKLSRVSDGDLPPAQRVYIANSLKCRPPRNRNPTPEELAQCEPYLVRQIELLKPRIILAMGRFAVQSLLRSAEPIGRLRGRVHSYQGVPLVVTYHPAYLLRSPHEKAKAWDDLCLAAQTVEAAAQGRGRA